MKRRSVAFVILAGTALFASPVPAKQKPATQAASLTPEQAETNYVRTVEKRIGDILAGLELKDEAKLARVHDALRDQYRALRDWQAVKEGKLKEVSRQTGVGDKEQGARRLAARKALHDQFIARLSADLTPEQLEKVKDKMTYNKVKVTYEAYCEIVPNLTDQHKAKMLHLLVEAREEALDGGSAEEKSAIFKKYKGKINIYLSSQGYDVAKAYKDWGAKQKAKAAAKAATPATEPAKQ